MSDPNVDLLLKLATDPAKDQAARSQAARFLLRRSNDDINAAIMALPKEQHRRSMQRLRAATEGAINEMDADSDEFKKAEESLKYFDSRLPTEERREKVPLGESVVRFVGENLAPSWMRQKSPGDPYGAAAFAAQGGTPEKVAEFQRKDDERTRQAMTDHPVANIATTLASAIATGKALPPGGGVAGTMGRNAAVAGSTRLRSELSAGTPVSEALPKAGVSAAGGMLAGALPTGPGLGSFARGAAGGAAIGAGEEAGQAALDERPMSPWPIVLSGVGGAVPPMMSSAARGIRDPGTPRGQNIDALESTGGRFGYGGMDTSGMKPVIGTRREIGDVPDIPAGQARPHAADAPVRVEPGSADAMGVLSSRMGEAIASDIDNVDSILRSKFNDAHRAAAAARPAKDIDPSPLIQAFQGEIQKLDATAAPEIGELARKLEALTESVQVPGQGTVQSSRFGRGARFEQQSAPPQTVSRPRAISLADLIEIRREADRAGRAGKISGRGDAPFRSVAATARQMIDRTAPPELRDAIQKRADQLSALEDIHDKLVGAKKAEVDMNAAKQRRIAGTVEKVGQTPSMDAAGAAVVTNAQVGDALEQLQSLAADAGVELASGGLSGLQQIRGHRAVGELQFQRPSMSIGTNFSPVARDAGFQMKDPLMSRALPYAEAMSRAQPLPLIYGPPYPLDEGQSR